MDLPSLSEAIASKNWYALVAVVVFFAMAGWKRLKPDLYYRIPEDKRWVVPVVIGAATGFTDGYLAGKRWTMALLDALVGAALIGFGAMGIQGKAKAKAEAKASEPPKAPKAPPMAVLFVAAWLVSGCGFLKSTVPVVETIRDIARTRCAAYYSAQDGISMEDAFRSYCKAEQYVGPFIDLILQEQAAQAAQDGDSLGHPLPPGASQKPLRLETED